MRVATDSLWAEGATLKDQRIAQQHSNIIVIAILLTSTLGSILTTVLGPILLSRDGRVSPERKIYVIFVTYYFNFFHLNIFSLLSTV